MHYKNNREVKLGDRVIGKDCCGQVWGGIVIGARATSDTCNLELIPIQSPAFYLTAKDCLHAEDALLAAERAMDTWACLERRKVPDKPQATAPVEPASTTAN